jgi:hypothetical protein
MPTKKVSTNRTRYAAEQNEDIVPLFGLLPARGDIPSVAGAADTSRDTTDIEHERAKRQTAVCEQYTDVAETAIHDRRVNCPACDLRYLRDLNPD